MTAERLHAAAMALLTAAGENWRTGEAQRRRPTTPAPTTTDQASAPAMVQGGPATAESAATESGAEPTAVESAAGVVEPVLRAAAAALAPIEARAQAPPS